MHDENTAIPNGKKFEKNRLHYIAKFIDDIDGFPEQIRNSILDLHYTEIAKVYLKNKNLKLFFKYILKNNCPIKGFFNICQDILRFIKKSKKLR